MSLILQVRSRKTESSRNPQGSLGAHGNSLLTPTLVFSLSFIRDVYAIAIFYCIIVLDIHIIRYCTWLLYGYKNVNTYIHTNTYKVMFSIYQGKSQLFLLPKYLIPKFNHFSRFQLFHVKSIWHLYFLKKKNRLETSPFAIIIEVIQAKVITWMLQLSGQKLDWGRTWYIHYL